VRRPSEGNSKCTDAFDWRKNYEPLFCYFAELMVRWIRNLGDHAYVVITYEE
jgi:hypothetical protein